MSRFWAGEQNIKIFLQSQDQEKCNLFICWTNLLVYWQGSHLTMCKSCSWGSRHGLKNKPRGTWWRRLKSGYYQRNTPSRKVQGKVTPKLFPGFQKTLYWVVPQAGNYWAALWKQEVVVQKLAAWAGIGLQDWKTWSKSMLECIYRGICHRVARF